jgi:hypothetical protein
MSTELQLNCKLQISVPAILLPSLFPKSEWDILPPLPEATLPSSENASTGAIVVMISGISIVFTVLR